MPIKIYSSTGNTSRLKYASFPLTNMWVDHSMDSAQGGQTESGTQPRIK